jgi:hypothetical protein
MRRRRRHPRPAGAAAAGWQVPGGAILDGLLAGRWPLTSPAASRRTSSCQSTSTVRWEPSCRPGYRARGRVIDPERGAELECRRTCPEMGA